MCVGGVLVVCVGGAETAISNPAYHEATVHTAGAHYYDAADILSNSSGSQAGTMASTPSNGTVHSFATGFIIFIYYFY